jgi:glutamate--cysteine ligase
VPSPTRVLTAAEACRLAGEQADATFTTNGSARVGLEIEWLPRLVHDTTQAAAHAVVRHTINTAGPGPGGCASTFEPGGQVELSSPPLTDVVAATTAVTADAAHLGAALADAGVALVGLGLDPVAIGGRVVDSPRYSAMEAYFDHDGPAGRTMMRSTAAIQVNLDLTAPNGSSPAARWRLAHALGPVLAAAFANSPCEQGRATGWRSRRLATWLAIDPGRTAPVGGVEPRSAWADYALAARVMLIRRHEHGYEPVLAPFTFHQWIASGHELGYPTADDLAYHLTTLFPPVRPRGWLELRMLDSLPDRWWRVAAAVVTVLLDDEEAAARAARATADTGSLWIEAARDGPADPRLGAAARACFAAALDALVRIGADGGTQALAAEFVDRYVDRDRCPADDRLDELARDGALVPA